MWENCEIKMQRKYSVLQYAALCGSLGCNTWVSKWQIYEALKPEWALSVFRSEVIGGDQILL